MLRPRFWIMENVRGAIPFLGVPAQKIGPWCLWGYFPHVDVTYRAQVHRKKDVDHTAQARAAIPWEVSRAVLRTVERYWSVPSLLDMRPFRRHRHFARPSDVGSSAPRLDL